MEFLTICFKLFVVHTLSQLTFTKLRHSVTSHTCTRHMSDSRISLYLYHFAFTLYCLEGNGPATQEWSKNCESTVIKKNNITRNAPGATRVCNACFCHSTLHNTHRCRPRSIKVHQNILRNLSYLPLLSYLCMELDNSVFLMLSIQLCANITYLLSRLSLLLSTDYSLAKRLS